MNKQEILNKLYEKKGAETDNATKERLDNICNMLRLVPDGDVEKVVPEVKTYLNETSSRLSNDLDTIHFKLKEWISKNSYSVESDVIKTMNKRTRFFLNVFIVIIAAIAVLALLLTVLNLVYGDEFLNGWGEKLAGALGTLDFALGALGFIIERKDDMKKREIHNAAQEVKEGGDTEKFASVIVNNVTDIKNSFNTNIKIGTVKGDIVQGDKHCK